MPLRRRKGPPSVMLEESEVGDMWILHAVANQVLTPLVPRDFGSFSLPIEGDNRRNCCLKCSVVSSGDLYIVEKYIRHGGIMRMWDFRAYKLDQQCGRWEELRSLGNLTLFLCNLCSFVGLNARARLV
ncbi:hypothetical protein NL676_005316 [Syzygium grande]|nr:hypothetical protein NL676_005316 [Syzygium grande]